MGILQDTFDAELTKLPQLALRQLVTEKLHAVGWTDNALVERIVDHFLVDDGEEDFEWHDSEGPDIDITFTDEDARRLSEKVDNFIDKMPDVILGLAEAVAASIVQGIRKQWIEKAPAANTEIANFKRRLEIRWGDSLDGLRLLLELSREKGVQFHANHLRSRLKANRARNEVLSDLHIRACQVTAEIIALMETGFADGARARWRTLFEISTVATLIADGGDALAKRYLAYDVVARKKTMEEYQRCAADLGEKPLSRRELNDIETEYAVALCKFGKEFKEPYGWAVGFVGSNKNPKFNHLQEAANNAEMRIYYKLASFGVHAGPSAVEYQVGVLDNKTRIAGASNAGLDQPGSNTAHCLVRITSLLLTDKPSIDRIAEMKSLILLRDEITAAFSAAAQKLDRDEQKAKDQIVRIALQKIDAGNPRKRIGRNRR